MTQILRDLTAPALVEANQANLTELYWYLGQTPSDQRDPDLAWSITGAPDAEFNVVTRARFAPDADASEVDSAIERTLARFAARHVPMSWFVGPDPRPADLGARLERHGLRHAGARPGMAADLMPPRPDPDVPSGLTIAEALDAETVGIWARTAIRGFGMPDALADPAAEFYMTLPTGPDFPVRYYVGYLDDRPVATSSLFLGAGVAGIYAVSTLPEARRQGIGAAIVLAAMRDAQTLGYRATILQASSMGYPIYERLGFREYCKLDTYVGSPEE